MGLTDLLQAAKAFLETQLLPLLAVLLLVVLSLERLSLALVRARLRLVKALARNANQASARANAQVEATLAPPVKEKTARRAESE